MKAKEICAILQNTLGDSALSYLTVPKWTSEFKFGWESLDDDLHSGRLKSATTSEFIAKVHKMVMEDKIGNEKMIRKIGAAALDIEP